MRTPVIAASLTLLALGAPTAYAATTGGPDAAPSLPAGPPKVFEMAGYSQPDITPGLCNTISPKETRCTIPEMTAGRYYIQATGTSTATGDGAVQAIDIRLDGGGDEQICSKAQSATPKGGAPWTAGARTIRIGCFVQIVTDQKVMVRATYADQHANSDEKGPVLAFRKIPWSPFMNSVGFAIQQAAPAPRAADK